MDFYNPIHIAIFCGSVPALTYLTVRLLNYAHGFKFFPSNEEGQQKRDKGGP